MCILCYLLLSSIELYMLKYWGRERFTTSLEMSSCQFWSVSITISHSFQTLAPSPPTLSISARDSGVWSLIGGEMIPWLRTEPGLELDTIYLVSVKFFCHFLSVCSRVENLFELFQLLPQNKCSSSFLYPRKIHTYWQVLFQTSLESLKLRISKMT